MKSLFSVKILMVLSLCVGSLTLSAQPSDEECSEEKLFSYFPKEFVMNTLQKFQVPKDRWEPIYHDLASKDDEIIKTVEDKASRLSPNPLQDPKERHVAVKIFRETLQQVFTNVMNTHGISNENQIKMMLDDIQKQKAELFATCMKKKAPQGSEKGQQPAGEDDDYGWDEE